MHDLHETAAQPSRELTLLVVDDSIINIRLLETALSKEGYRILTADNGPQARKLAVEHRPDLILLDIMMPGEDGFSVIRFLKNHSATAAIPVIFLTGVSEIESKIEGFDLGAVDYIIKPFHPMEVLARVRLHLKLSIATNSLIASQAQKLRQIHKAQTSLLVAPESLPEARFGVHYESLQEAGGDFYDVIAISKDIHGYFVADFSGHDISISYLTASIKALMKQNCTPIYQPSESIKLINDVLVEILPEDKYLTASYAHLNRKTMKLTLVNAGHPPAIYVPKNGLAQSISMDGDILGIFRNVIFGTRTLSVQPGDRFYLYSDGLVENTRTRTTWPEASRRMLKVCEEVRHLSVAEAVRSIRENLIAKGIPIEDDIVVMSVEI
ncbi:fused response regulator/phosphatase [Desulfobotulus sp. H1]|uniref:Fused response regulator/phosphatase n=1 Tax=Desulfobotulus pelophilus TaxID=2823377 RepID=A0ABT3N8R9_9BACT|nr:fused response regulator/phosphatase [Desulfobotulus pelophilus]MCW7753852.1 fused response regulator/phosphatase [Desulfobotulus pelophilus]